MKIAPNIVIDSLNTQARVMINAAANGYQKEFEQTATAFFRKANETGQIGNAINAYYTSLREVQSNLPLRKRIMNALEFNSLHNDVIDCVELANRNDVEFKNEAKRFVTLIKKNYPKSLEDRISSLDNGTVNSVEIHQPTKKERLRTILSKNLRAFFGED